MKTKTKKQVTLFMVAIIAILVSIGTIRFLIVTAKYIDSSDELRCIEQTANTGILTKNGLEHWTEDLVNQYEKSLQNKQEFIESSDVATYLYYSGFSKTGQVIRILSIVGNIVLLYMSIKYIFRYIRYLIKQLIRCLKRLFCRSKR